VSAGSASFSAATSTCTSPAISAELMALSAAISPFPGPCFQVPYCRLQSAGATECVGTGELVTAGELVTVGRLVGVADDAVLLHAAIPTTAAPTAASKALHLVIRSSPENVNK
jgi:hypothetical protein